MSDILMPEGWERKWPAYYNAMMSYRKDNKKRINMMMLLMQQLVYMKCMQLETIEKESNREIKCANKT